jgi:hypothetical protein
MVVLCHVEADMESKASGYYSKNPSLSQEIESTCLPGIAGYMISESNRVYREQSRHRPHAEPFYDATLNEYPRAGTIIAVGTGAP